MVKTLYRLLLGALAGAAATAAMSVIMVGSRRIGAVRSTAEPKVITEAGLDAADLDVSEGTSNALSTVSHVGYGSVMGAFFRLVQPRVPLPPVISGSLFGLGILTASYQGWVPAAGIMPSLKDQESARRSQLVLSHLLYGAVLGALTSARRREARI